MGVRGRGGLIAKEECHIWLKFYTQKRKKMERKSQRMCIRENEWQLLYGQCEYDRIWFQEDRKKYLF